MNATSRMPQRPNRATACLTNQCVVEDVGAYFQNLFTENVAPIRATTSRRCWQTPGSRGALSGPPHHQLYMIIATAGHPWTKPPIDRYRDVGVVAPSRSCCRRLKADLSLVPALNRGSGALGDAA